MNTQGISSHMGELGRVGQKAGEQNQGFSDVIKDAISNLKDVEAKADESLQGLIEGKTGIHEAMLKQQEVDLLYRLLLQFRNKAMEGYHEVMRMQF
ncbi:MAG: flagellar hook-basal body complex protein FliE [Pseudomonadota bacterium]